MKIGLQAWGSEGDIQPFTALAAGLVKSGHTVTLVVTDNIGRDYSELAKRFGYQLVSVSNPEIPSAEAAEKVWRQIIDLGNPIKQAELVMRYGFDPVMERMYTAARNLCASNDAVLGHFFVYPLRVAAEKAGVPVGTLNIVHNCLPSKFICPPARSSASTSTQLWAMRRASICPTRKSSPLCRLAPSCCWTMAASACGSNITARTMPIRW